ncbi:hypothetical protein GWK47_006856 [Chionoecetes opilio]|uniref:Uncharacterized protein n=1 Tax=Chionoecetes opilio TaxID=41210 RepID=A0A8J4Y4B8_CHIOP|nr:hypothetical protein GWK47_006856 [Chionoecetes opilio]
MTKHQKYAMVTVSRRWTSDQRSTSKSNNNSDSSTRKTAIRQEEEVNSHSSSNNEAVVTRVTYSPVSYMPGHPSGFCFLLYHCNVDFLSEGDHTADSGYSAIKTNGAREQAPSIGRERKGYRVAMKEDMCQLEHELDRRQQSNTKQKRSQEEEEEASRKQWRANPGNLKLRSEIHAGKLMELEY